ncbi:isochorismate synthase [Natronomonas salina]|uniref:isochorismate synthase n=1 Tax=Natronomonas salina TaxID=1710540 RepID=UPI0015B5733D|nr:isochorismate synthase [Natronomonas salina]QLD88157.1 isochorismate synthase [Natronomonas salina]
MEPLRSEEAVPDGEGLVCRTERLREPPRPRAALSAADAPRTLWAAPAEATVVGSGAAATIAADGPDRFAAVREAADDLFATGNVHAGTLAARPRLFGGFAFHDEHAADGPWDGYPGAEFVLPRVQVTYTDDEAWLSVNAVGADPDDVETRLETAREELLDRPDPGPVADPPGVVSRARTTSKAEWRESVTAAVDRIEAGELRKVVLAQALEARLERPLDVPAALTRLSGTYPDCFRFLVEPRDGEASFFGATPERLVGLRGRTVETGALAGTTGRGDTPEEDEWLAAELLDDDKNVHEHELVADAIREQLAPYASSIQSGRRDVRRLATVQHIETPITAELAADEHVLTLVEALHPTPAVGGLPPDEALRTIRDTEPFERGWYAAPVGWFDAAGYGSFAVAIRSAVARGDVATLFAGVGIVADSDPDREWDEVQLKYRPILDELE